MTTDMRIEFEPDPHPELLTPDSPGAHVWVAVCAFRLSTVPRPGVGVEGRVNLDQENLASINVGCYVCEQPWSAALAGRICPGDPSE